MKPGSRSSNWLFATGCVFLVSQIFWIPLLPFGPWQLWIRMSDLAFLLMLCVWVLTNGSKIRLNKSGILGVQLAWLAVGLATFSFFCFTVIPDPGILLSPGTFHSGGYGVYAIVRLLQFAILGVMFNSLPFDDRRLRIVEMLYVGCLLLAVTLSFLNFVQLINPPNLAFWLPNGSQAGPWWVYKGHVGKAYGILGYNHAYNAAQIMLMTAVAIQLHRKNNGWTMFLLMVGGTGVFISGSRAGLISFVIFALALLLQRITIYRLLFGLTVLAAIVPVVILGSGLQADSHSSSILSRQLTAINISDPENLSGRAAIWQSTLDAVLDADVVSWLFGSGLGSLFAVGYGAHSLPLTYFVEFGLVGITAIAIGFWLLLRRLGKVGEKGTAMYWLIVSLLTGSLTQETFYPTAASGHFMGFLLAAVIIVLNDYRPYLQEKSGR